MTTNDVPGAADADDTTAPARVSPERWRLLKTDDARTALVVGSGTGPLGARLRYFEAVLASCLRAWRMEELRGLETGRKHELESQGILDPHADPLSEFLVWNERRMDMQAVVRWLAPPLGSTCTRAGLDATPVRLIGNCMNAHGGAAPWIAPRWPEMRAPLQVLADQADAVEARRENDLALPTEAGPLRPQPHGRAIEAYRLHVLMGKTTREIAAILSEGKGRKYWHGTISKWIISVKEFLSAGGVLPQSAEAETRPRRRVRVMKPAVLERGRPRSASRPRSP